jgi:hypothetical protein
MKLTIVTTLGLLATVTLAIAFTLVPYTVVQKVLALDCDCVECICNPIQIAPSLGGTQIPDKVPDLLNKVEDQINHRIDQYNQRIDEVLTPLPELPR